MSHILVVEDDENTLALLQIIMNRGGYTVQRAFNAAEALYSLEHESVPDLIILDLMLPGVDGIALCKLIRSQGATRETPILILTARTDPVAGSDSLEAGANAFLNKPIRQSDLLEKISSLLGE